MTAKPTPGHDQTLTRQTLAGTRFVKITGPIGDWIVFFDPSDKVELTEELVVALCDREAGVGASGVVVVTSAKQNLSGTSPEYRIDAWRPDGQLAQNLTEPARAATCALAALHKIAVHETSHHAFETSFGPVTTVYTPTYIGVDIGRWTLTAADTAEAAGTDALVMAAGLTDPRPGLSIHIQQDHVTIAVETARELEAIDLSQPPSIEPTPEVPTSIGFLVPKDPLIVDGMGQIQLRTYSAETANHGLASACAAATIALQSWSGLQQLNIWNVATQNGELVVQIHDEHRVSAFAKLSTVYFGKL